MNFQKKIQTLFSNYCHIGTSQDHSFILTVFLNEDEKKKQKKIKKGKQQKKREHPIFSKLPQLSLPFKPGKGGVHVMTVPEFLKKGDSLQKVLEKINKKEFKLDYLIATRDELPLLKPVSRKLTQLGIMPSLQGGTLVEREEEKDLLKEKLASSNVKRVRYQKGTLRIVLGDQSMTLEELHRNVQTFREWILENLEKKEIQSMSLSIFHYHQFL